MKIKITRDIWGNYKVRVGNKTILETCSEYDARFAMTERWLDGGLQVSDKSYFSQADMQMFIVDNIDLL